MIKVKPTFTNTTAKTVMNRVTTSAMPFSWSLNPYRGCTHGCSFCYARSTHTFMGKHADDSFRTDIYVKGNAPEALEYQLEKMAKQHNYNLAALADDIGLLQIGTATDPYQPIEGKLQVTRSCLEVLARYQVPVSITTRSPLVLRDIDLLKRVDLRAVYISLHTLDTEIWRNLEPATPSPMKRLETVKTLVEHGIHTGILVAPIVPCLTDSESHLGSVIHAAKEHGAHFLSPSVLRLNPEVKTWFLSVVKERYPLAHRRLRAMYVGTYAPKTYTTRVMERAYNLMTEYGFSRYDREELASPKERSRDDSCVYLEGKSIQLALPI